MYMCVNGFFFGIDKPFSCSWFRKLGRKNCCAPQCWKLSSAFLLFGFFWKGNNVEKPQFVSLTYVAYLCWSYRQHDDFRFYCQRYASIFTFDIIWIYFAFINDYHTTWTNKNKIHWNVYTHTHSRSAHSVEKIIPWNVLAFLFILSRLRSRALSLLWSRISIICNWFSISVPTYNGTFADYTHTLCIYATSIPHPATNIQ